MPQVRGGGRGSVTTLAVVAVAAGVSIVAVVTRLIQPSSGAALPASGPGAVETGAYVEPLAGTASSFRHGDLVVAIADVPLATWAAGPGAGAPPELRLQVGEPVPVTLVRDGQTLTLPVVLQSFPTAAVVLSAWGTLSFVALLLVVAVAVFWKRPGVPAAGALLLASIGATGSTPPYLFGLDPLDVASGHVTPYLAAIGGVYLLLWAGLMDFALVFPRPFEPVLTAALAAARALFRRVRRVRRRCPHDPGDAIRAAGPGA